MACKGGFTKILKPRGIGGRPRGKFFKGVYLALAGQGGEAPNFQGH